MSEVKQLLEIGKKLIDFVDNELKPKITKSDSSLNDISIFLFAKSTKTFRALFILCAERYGEDAAILARSLLENLINLAYIEKEESEHRAELFISHSVLDNKKKVDSIKNDPAFKKLDIERKFDDRFGGSLETIRKMQKEECEKVKKIGKYRIKKYSWSCLSIKDMAIETGLKSPYYDKVYWLISQFSHPHVGSSKGYLYKDKTGFTINDLPSKIWVEESLVLGFDCYSKMVHLINKLFKLNLKSQIKLLEKEYLKIFKK